MWRSCKVDKKGAKPHLIHFGHHYCSSFYNLLSGALHHSPDSLSLELIFHRQRQHFFSFIQPFPAIKYNNRHSFVLQQQQQRQNQGIKRGSQQTSNNVTMSNAKYTPAPQEDPDYAAPAAGPAFSQQAPPAYQQAAAADDEARLFAGGDGVPRSSEDNVPDDFKFGGSVAEATIDIRNQFIRKVYTILTVQLLVTGAVSTISFVSPTYKDWIQSHPALVFISVRLCVLLPSLE